MPTQYLHGVEVIEIDKSPRPIRTVDSAVIGIVGTAPQALTMDFPLHTPVLIAGSRSEAAKLGITGTLPAAIDGILDQAGASIVVVRVPESADAEEQLSHVLGGVDSATGQHLGLHALVASEAVLGVTPKLLIAPGFTQSQAVVSELLGLADRLRAIIIADGPNTNDQEAIHYREQFGNARVFLVDPFVKVFNTATHMESAMPASSRVAGVIARTDHDKGFWCSPSNQEIYGITGTARAIDFSLGDANARANLLNAHEITTIIQKNGFRLWGNRTCSSDPKWAFLSVRRTADMIHESLLNAHLWAVDRAISKTYIEEVREGVKAYLRYLKAIGAIIDGDCWADPALNTPTQIAAGTVYFDFDFTPPYPAEHVIFRSQLVQDYLTEILP